MVIRPRQRYSFHTQNIGRPAHVCVQVLFFFLSVCVMAEENYLTIEAALEKAFPESAQCQQFIPELSREQARLVFSKAHPKKNGKLQRIYVAHNDGVLDGVVFIDNAIGRTEHFTYACALNKDGSIKRIDVLTYREPYGNEIRKRSWLKRFVGKKYGAGLRHKRDIPNLNGATLSCRGMVERVRFLVTYYDLVLSKQVADWLPQASKEPLANVKKVERSAIIGEPVFRIELLRNNNEAVEALQAHAQAGLQRAEKWDAHINTWNPESELSLALQGKLTTVSDGLKDFINHVQAMHRLTKGSVDPSVKPLIDVWYQADKNQKIPDTSAINDALKHVGLKKTQWDAATKSLSCPTTMRWDASALAKGWMIDRVYDELTKQKLIGSLHYGESSVRALGETMQVAVRDPKDPGRVFKTISLKAGQAISSSGTYHRQLVIGDEQFSYFINPKNGQPIRTARAATVIAANTALADALSTMACLLPAEESLPIIDGIDGCAAHIWIGDKQHASKSWPQ